MAEYEQQSLDGILDGTEPPKQEAPAAPVEKTEAEKPIAETRTEPLDRPRRADGTFKSKEEIDAEKPKEEPAKAEVVAEKPAEIAKPAAIAQPQMDPQVRAFLAAAKDERQKRQELERQLAEIRQRLPQTEAEKPKTFWDDPEGWMKKQQSELQQTTMQERLRVSEMIARSRYPDFEEKLVKFQELATTVPGLAQQWLAAPDQGEFAYHAAKNHILLNQAGSVEKMRENIEKEVRAKVEAELKAKSEDLAKQKAALPGTLSTVRGAASQQTPVFTGPTSLDDVLARPRKKA